jgi:hypothetical protein
MSKRKSTTRHTDHEGARESSQPGEPQAREVFTPDWVSLEKATQKKTAQDKRTVSPPSIDRHR